LLQQQRFGEALGQRVGIWPTQFVGASPPCFGELVAKPADPVLSNLIVECGSLQIFGGMLFAPCLTTQLLGDLWTFGSALGILNQLVQRPPFQFSIEIRRAAPLSAGCSPLAAL